MDQNEQRFLDLNSKCHKHSEAKIKEGINMGALIREIMKLEILLTCEMW